MDGHRYQKNKTDIQIDICIDRRTDEWVDLAIRQHRQIDKLMDRRMDGQMNRYKTNNIDGWIGEWMDIDIAIRQIIQTDLYDH